MNAKTINKARAVFLALFALILCLSIGTTPTQEAHATPAVVYDDFAGVETANASLNKTLTLANADETTLGAHLVEVDNGYVPVVNGTRNKAIYYHGPIEVGPRNNPTTNDTGSTVAFRWNDAVTLEDGTLADFAVYVDDISIAMVQSNDNPLGDPDDYYIPLFYGNQFHAASSTPVLDPADPASQASGILAGASMRFTCQVQQNHQPVNAKIAFFAYDLDARSTVNYPNGAKPAEGTDEWKSMYSQPWSESIELVEGFGPVHLAKKEVHNGNIQEQGLIASSNPQHGGTRLHPDGEAMAATRGDKGDPNTYWSGFVSVADAASFSFYWMGSYAGTGLFAQGAAKIVASHDEGGAIEKLGTTNYPIAATTTYDYTPSEGYAVEALKVDGADVAFDKAGGAYRFEKIDYNPLVRINADGTAGEPYGTPHTIHVDFYPLERAAVKYIDITGGGSIDVNGSPVAGSMLEEEGAIYGDGGEAVPSQASTIIAKYAGKGYELVDNGMAANPVFDTILGNTQEYAVTLKPIVEPVSVANPKEPTDTMNPDGTAYPAGLDIDSLKKTITRTIHYIYADGSQAAEDVIQEAVYTRTATVNHVTGEVVYADWASDDPAYDAVASPAVRNHTASRDGIEAKATTAQDGDSVEVVVYAQKPNQAGSVTFADEGGKELGKATFDGEELTPFGVDIEPTIKEYTDKGYELVDNGYPGKDTIYDDDATVDQDYVVVLAPVIEPITMDNPKTQGDQMNPDGAAYPAGLSASDLQRVVTRTIRYVYADGSQAAEDVVQQVVFTRSATVNHVTGEVAYSDWSAEGEVAEVASPEIAKHVVDKATVAALEVGPFSTGSAETVTYEPLYTVTFVDGFGTTLKAEEGIPFLGSATPPQDPEMDGYVFTGWDVRYDKITEDIVVTATWIPVEPAAEPEPQEEPGKAAPAKEQAYTVTFVDGFGHTLKVQDKIPFKGSATAPEDPTKPGYAFAGWDVAFDEVTKDMVVTALWTPVDASGIKDAPKSETPTVRTTTPATKTATTSTTPAKATPASQATAKPYAKTGTLLAQYWHVAAILLACIAGAAGYFAYARRRAASGGPEGGIEEAAEAEEEAESATGEE